MVNEYQGVINSLQAHGHSNMFNRARQQYNCDISELPISTNVLNNNHQNIIISPEITEDLALIKATIDRQRASDTTYEMPFALLGHKEGDNVVIDQIQYYPEDFNTSGRQAVASFKRLQKDFEKHCKSDGEPVVILGHTHPGKSQANNCHSLHDLYQAKVAQDMAKRINPNATVSAMIINPAGDFNTISYNRETDNFERFNDVFLGEDRLPSFSDGNYPERTPSVRGLNVEEMANSDCALVFNPQQAPSSDNAISSRLFPRFVSKKPTFTDRVSRLFGKKPKFSARANLGKLRDALDRSSQKE